MPRKAPRRNLLSALFGRVGESEAEGWRSSCSPGARWCAWWLQNLRAPFRAEPRWQEMRQCVRLRVLDRRSHCRSGVFVAEVDCPGAQSSKMSLIVAFSILVICRRSMVPHISNISINLEQLWSKIRHLYVRPLFPRPIIQVLKSV